MGGWVVVFRVSDVAFRVFRFLQARLWRCQGQGFRRARTIRRRTSTTIANNNNNN